MLGKGYANMKMLAFGEIMMRVAPEAHLRFRQVMPGKVDIIFAGAEASVCASLAIFGAETRYLTALPDNPIAGCAIATLKGLGIDTSRILLLDKGRLGIYFVETGANQRSSTVIYDREGSSISLAGPKSYDFDGAMAGMDWLHVTGITPALSENAYLSTLEAVRKAKEKGVRVSCDLNFRKKLWHWKKGCSPDKLARECMTSILPFVHLVIANEEDAKDVLGIEAEGTSVEEGRISADAYQIVAKGIIARFPNIGKVAFTFRESVSADYNKWGGMLFDQATDKAYFAPLNDAGEYTPYHIRDIVDRVGGGDSFSAGLIYALNSEEFQEPGSAVGFAVAASCLKHSVKGDFNYITRDEVISLLRGSASGRVRR